MIRVIDASVDKVFLDIHIPAATAMDSLILFRNNVRVKSFILSNDTTVISDTGLSESSMYSYRVESYGPSFHKNISNSLTVETLQPSSHEVVWETFFLGEGNLSLLSDVAIIEDNNIWAGGDLRFRDSTGGFDPKPYNLARWDGTTWTVERVLFPICGAGGEAGTYPFPCASVFAFGQDDVWVTEGGSMVQWDGAEFRRMCLPQGLIQGGLTEIWGSPFARLYCVGENGTIITSQSGLWQQINSGTSTGINDIWGFVNPLTGNEEAYCAVTSPFVPGDRRIIRIRGLDADSIMWDTGRNVDAVWTNKGHPVIAAGDGLFENSTGSWVEVDLGANSNSNCVRGTSLADIFVVGASGLVAHYSGRDWMVYDDVYPAHYFSVAVSDNVVAMVGSDFNLGVITLGRRP